MGWGTWLLLSRNFLCSEVPIYCDFLGLPSNPNSSKISSKWIKIKTIDCSWEGSKKWNSCQSCRCNNDDTVSEEQRPKKRDKPSSDKSSLAQRYSGRPPTPIQRCLFSCFSTLLILTLFVRRFSNCFFFPPVLIFTDSTFFWYLLLCEILHNLQSDAWKVFVLSRQQHCLFCLFCPSAVTTDQRSPPGWILWNHSQRSHFSSAARSKLLSRWQSI